MSSGPSESITASAALPPAGAPATAATAATPPAAPLFSAAAWSPLKVELFRSLYIATSIAQIGTWAREAASPSLMMMLTQGWRNQPDMVGRITLYSSMPICLFSLFAGALADVLDRRRLLIWTNLWMIAVSVVLGLMTLAGLVTPWGLLGMTFLLGLGTAASGPALQAVLPELVPPKDMALAINLNSVALNVARAVGPATFILVVWVVPGKVAGIGTSFLLSALTFAGAAWVLFRWKRPPQRAALHGEGVLGAIRTGATYTAHSPANRAILFRVTCFIVPALVLWSQVPVIAQNQLGMPRTPESYALLFAFVGIGAIFGVLLMPGLHARYKIDPVVNSCIFLFAVGLFALAFTHSLWLAGPILVFLGINWVIIPTNFNTATQKSVPPWVKGRAISFYLTVLFGSFALGGALWGRVTTATSITTSLLIGGASMAMLLCLSRWFPLTINEGLDLSPAFKPGAASDGAATVLIPSPAMTNDGAPKGPVAVRIEYAVTPDRREAFLAAAREMGQHRRRNGARQWELTRGGADHYVESFHFASAEEAARQRNRLTKADLALHTRLAGFHASGAASMVQVHPASALRSPGRAARSFDAACDRAMDELANGVARVRGVPDRVRPGRFIP